MKATYDDTAFTLTGTYWSGTYPLEDLPSWLGFYRQQRDLHPKATGKYDASIAELERLTSEVDQPFGKSE
ncbi:hypothetical protein [Paracoccus sp. PAR01]|uniref:hypothetical protein n=1 Tax=Paracoccus TaxID=265 RepID=UPI00178587AE|nr:hypothetical protein [Paracoccus sp. PAR01]MBD9529076.1 hypothetical protein [Paracoccus sp. PAR01]